jgi:hypothetical protein
MKNIVYHIYYLFFTTAPKYPLNQACLRKIVPWLEFQRSYVHAERDYVQAQTKAVFL